MERLDPKPPRASKRTFFMLSVGSALAAGIITFLLLLLLFQLQSGTSGSIAAGVAVVVGGIVAAVASPTPHRER